MKSQYSQRQALFANCLGHFLVWLFDNGYEATMASGYEQPDKDGNVPFHMKDSLHGERMAQDINIYLNGDWLDGLDTGNHGAWQLPHWKKIGDAWKALHPELRWGGDFQTKDWNHFSILSLDGKRA